MRQHSLSQYLPRCSNQETVLLDRARNILGGINTKIIVVRDSILRYLFVANRHPRGIDLCPCVSPKLLDGLKCKRRLRPRELT